MKERQTVKGINIGGWCCRLTADKKDTWPRQMRKWKVWWSGKREGSLVQLQVCRPVPPKSTPHPPFPAPIFRHVILHYYVKTSRRLSSPSAADRTIMEHSLVLFLIHASCDKGTCFFFFFFFFFTSLGAACSFSCDHRHVTWDFHTTSPLSRILLFMCPDYAAGTCVFELGVLFLLCMVACCVCRSAAKKKKKHN